MSQYLEGLQRSLRDMSLRSWEIVHMQADTESFSAVTPRRLQAHPTYTWRLSEPGAGLVNARNAEFRSFLKMIENCKIGPAIANTEHLDVRWGTQLLDENRKVVFSLYLDRLRDRAIVNTEIVFVDPKVRQWMTDFSKRRFV